MSLKLDWPQVYDGEWVRPRMDGFELQCCDCGLKHKINFKAVKRRGKYHVFFQAFRMPRPAKIYAPNSTDR